MVKAKRKISIGIIFVMIVGLLMITGIANAESYKTMYNNSIGSNSKVSSIIKGNVGQINIAKRTKYNASQKTLSSKSKTINGKKYTFKIIQQNKAKAYTYTKRSNPNDIQSKIDEKTENMGDVNVLITIPTIKGYKLKSTKSGSSSKTPYDNISRVTTKTPTNGTIVEKSTESMNSTLKNASISNINCTKKTITVSYTITNNVVKKNQIEKIEKKGSKFEKYKRDTGYSQNMKIVMKLTYTKK